MGLFLLITFFFVLLLVFFPSLVITPCPIISLLHLFIVGGGGWDEQRLKKIFQDAKLLTDPPDVSKGTKPKSEVYQHIYLFTYRNKDGSVVTGWGCNYCTFSAGGRPVIIRVKAHLGALGGYQISICDIVSCCVENAMTIVVVVVVVVVVAVVVLLLVVVVVV